MEKSLFEYFLDAYQKFLVLNGRATRQQFWGFYVWYYVIIIGLILVTLPIAYLTKSMAIFIIPIGFAIISLFPYVSIAVRRLHDVGHSGWNLLLPYGAYYSVYVIVQLFFPVLLPVDVSPAVINFIQSITPEKIELVALIFKLVAFTYVLYLLAKPSEDTENSYGVPIVEING